MRSNPFMLSAIALLIAAFFVEPAMAMNFGPKAYDATYKMNFGGQVYNQRRISDGKGRMRSELATPSGKMVNIEDDLNKVSYTIVTERKMAMKRSTAGKSPMDSKNFVVSDETTAKKIGAVPLGKKMIDGHPCLGFRYNHRGNVSEAWIGQDIGTVVLMTSNSPQGDVSMRLTSCKPFDGNNAWFKPPANFKVVEMPSLGAFRNPAMLQRRKSLQRSSSMPTSPYGNFQGNPNMNMDMSKFAQGGMTPEKMQNLKKFAEQMKLQFSGLNRGTN